MPAQNRSTSTTPPNQPAPSWSSNWEEAPDTDREQQARSPDDTPLGKAHAAMPGYEGRAYDKPEDAEDTEDTEDTGEEQQAAEGEAEESRDPNEGEGNRTAARRYAAGVQRTIQQGDVEEHAEEAAKALDGPEAEELKRAEQQGKRGPSATTPRH